MKACPSCIVDRESTSRAAQIIAEMRAHAMEGATPARTTVALSCIQGALRPTALTKAGAELGSQPRCAALRRDRGEEASSGAAALRMGPGAPPASVDRDRGGREHLHEWQAASADRMVTRAVGSGGKDVTGSVMPRLHDLLHLSPRRWKHEASADQWVEPSRWRPESFPFCASALHNLQRIRHVRLILAV